MTIRSAVFAIALAACAQSKSQHAPAASVAATETSPKADKDQKQQQLGIDGKPADNRKVIRTGRVELVVAAYDDARAKIDALIKATGGYIDSTQVDRHQAAVSDATLVIRVPSDSFDSMIPKLREIGEVTSESSNAADITDQFVDTQARLASDQQLETRLLELATARNGNLDQILAVERELARVRGEIESYQGHLKQWSDQVAMSTLTISVSTRRAELVAAAPPTLGSQTKAAFHSSVSALRDLGEWAFINGIAFLPWLLVLVPLGVIGRKLYRRVRLPRAIVQTSRQEPGASPSSVSRPIWTRTSRSVGSPTAAVMRRTWRLRPSRIVSSIHESGTVLRTRIGGNRGHNHSGGSITRASAGSVRPSLRSTPLRSCSTCSVRGTPSTCAQ